MMMSMMFAWISDDDEPLSPKVHGLVATGMPYIWSVQVVVEKTKKTC